MVNFVVLSAEDTSYANAGHQVLVSADGVIMMDIPCRAHATGRKARFITSARGMKFTRDCNKVVFFEYPDPVELSAAYLEDPVAYKQAAADASYKKDEREAGRGPPIIQALMRHEAELERVMRERGSLFRPTKGQRVTKRCRDWEETVRRRVHPRSSSDSDDEDVSEAAGNGPTGRGSAERSSKATSFRLPSSGRPGSAPVPVRTRGS